MAFHLDRWHAVVDLLDHRALLRLGLLAVQGGRMIEHQTVPERAEVLSEENQHLFNTETLDKYRSVLPPHLHGAHVDGTAGRIRTQGQVGGRGKHTQDEDDVLVLRRYEHGFPSLAPLACHVRVLVPVL